MFTSALTRRIFCQSPQIGVLLRKHDNRGAHTGFVLSSSFDGFHGSKHWPICNSVRMKHSYPPFISAPNANDVKKLMEGLSVRSDPGETKYWLAQFQKFTDNSKDPFAVVHISSDVFESLEELKALASSVSLLQKLNLPCVLLHGLPGSELQQYNFEKSAKETLTNNTMALVDLLESFGSPARPLFAGSGVIEASLLPVCCSHTCALATDPDLILRSMRTGHIPVIPCVGATRGGQLMPLHMDDVLALLLPQVTPRKVLMVNFDGALLDERGEVISNINVPKDLEWAYMMPWCTRDVRKRIEYISELLHKLSPQTSIVLTSPVSLLTELFTHNGSGTLFKNTEAIKTYTSLEDIDSTRLLEVINSDFGRELGEAYLNELAAKLNTLYLSEDYNAVAIVTNEPGMSVPYLDKFSMTDAGKTDGLCQLQWDMIRRDFPKLFWRSRHANKVSSWYFKKCEGSWTNGEWIVFWYGIPSHKESSILTDYALTLEDAFATTVKDSRPVQ